MILYIDIPNLMVDFNIVDARTLLMLIQINVVYHSFNSSWIISASNVHAGLGANPINLLKL